MTRSIRPAAGFLVVRGHTTPSDHIVDVLSASAPTSIVRAVEDAHRSLRDRPWSGLILYDLAELSLRTLAHRVRVEHHDLPCLVALRPRLIEDTGLPVRQVAAPVRDLHARVCPVGETAPVRGFVHSVLGPPPRARSTGVFRAASTAHSTASRQPPAAKRARPDRDRSGNGSVDDLACPAARRRRVALADEARRAGLTERQVEILALHLEGHDTARVTYQLDIRSKTYSNHVTAILRKTGDDSISLLAIRILNRALALRLESPDGASQDARGDARGDATHTRLRLG